MTTTEKIMSLSYAIFFCQVRLIAWQLRTVSITTNTIARKLGNYAEFFNCEDNLMRQ